MFANLFKPVHPEKLNENFFRLINKDWMLVTAGSSEKFNTMTASWGTIGILWNKPIAVCFIRPHRYTFQFTEKSAYFTLSFFDSSFKKALNYCGSHSGREFDKVAQTGLIPIVTPGGSIAFENARLILECKKLYSDFLREENFIAKDLVGANYSTKDFHKFFIGEIEGCYIR
jgi:flavin reductase (DIM6/NTAB) family NADH-FMN oxidoreductase RutF